MRLEFTKMHGLGNDFVVIDATSQSVMLSPDQVRLLADRRFGIGCDQILLIEHARSTEADFRYRIFNADGNEVEQCGNGARCFARYVWDKGYIEGGEIRAETAVGRLILTREADNQVTVNMGTPILTPAHIPFQADSMLSTYELCVDKEQVSISAVSMGNPHAVVVVDNVQIAPVADLGPKIESHPRFPKRVNVGFMQVVEQAVIRLRVYERGVGETMACGSGACAAVVAGRLRGLLTDQVMVDLPGGKLIIHWAGGDAPVMMTGPAVYVFEGSIPL
jgi:diaminopimelate epimerase